MKDIKQHSSLTPKQSAYIQAYASPDSASFGNSYQSALLAGYSFQTARNMTHLRPEWLSENIGQMAVIKPQEIMQELTTVIHNENEPTIIRLKAMELSMKAYSMLQQRTATEPTAVSISIDLSQS
ncbi:MAG: hypothetical protein H6797_05375 [Candidatus Nomurabacteria bacterium]|nr:MAG: hypothetical protein H6797_05375 [Candidatus Nomurabacteria bacterium]